MNIVWFTWKDIMHPEAGGAEKISSEMAKRLAKDGHHVTVLTSRFPGSKHEEDFSGYKIIRVGNRFTVYILAGWYFIKHLRTSTDLIIEEINTIPFMTQWYSKCKRSLVIYQLCREIWFYQLVFPLSLIGYLIEPAYLWLLRNNKVLTESESTKKDLQKYGFNKANISIFPISIDIKPLKSIDDKKTYKRFTVLSFGAIRSMKRTLDQVKAFEISKKQIPELQMKIAGQAIGSYGERVLRHIRRSRYKDDIEYLGKVTKEQKIELMRKSHVILVTSVKEGWGLIVTEAASQGTPAIVYDVDGLRDAQGSEMLITHSQNPNAVSDLIYKLHNNQPIYNRLSIKALHSSAMFYENTNDKDLLRIIVRK